MRSVTSTQHAFSLRNIVSQFENHYARFTRATLAQRTESGMNPCYSFGLHGAERLSAGAGVVPNSAPCQIMHPLEVTAWLPPHQLLNLPTLGVHNLVGVQNSGTTPEQRAALDHTTPLYTALGDTVKKVVEFAAESVTSQSDLVRNILIWWRILLKIRISEQMPLMWKQGKHFFQ